MSEGSGTGRDVRQGYPLSLTLFNIYLEDFVKNCFQNMGGVIVGGRIIKSIRSADDMALLVEKKTILRTHFDIGCHARIPTRNTILRWVASFHITGSTLKKKSPGRNSIALRLSEATVRSRALRLLSLGPFEGVFTSHAMKALGGTEVEPHAFHDLGTRMRWCGRHHALTAFYPRERPGTQFYRRLSEPRARSGSLATRKSRHHLGSNPDIPVRASCSTN
ncbi:hypothetical protein ANN_12527 [Periplaneta americana]|uniref:DUF4817 domain-containing protein n=1 Tax=Periplaneta americana TaxID=6978 RepID=A0ABQ8THF6_PERAM|nr:hypothetical protein ANN_12527 [Periplaneta americana]